MKTKPTKDELIKAINSGKSMAEVAKLLGVSRATLYRLMQAHDIELQRKAVVHR